MLSIISPAKSMDFKQNYTLCNDGITPTQPQFSDRTRVLVKYLQKYDLPLIKKLMKISDKIAHENYVRYKMWDDEATMSKEAIFAYTGDTYQNINIKDIPKSNYKFVQNHLRIISGIYGILRPFDMIKPYRLEMCIKLPEISSKYDLAKYWQSTITDYLNDELQKHEHKYVINLASNEYSAALNWTALKYPIINIHFKEIRDNTQRSIPINAKRARGMFARAIILQKIETPDEIKNITAGGYHYSSSQSDGTNMFFVKS